MSNKSKIIMSLGIFLLMFFYYTATLNPVFHANDSPETIACSYTLGIQHPPGYPLFSLIGKIFTMIPAGNIGFRINLEAAFFGALTVVLLFLVIMNVLAKKDSPKDVLYTISGWSAVIFGFTYTMWSESLAAKGGIYTFNALLLVLMILILFTWERKKEYKYIYLFSLVYGLSLGNHWESVGVVTPAFAVYIFLVMKKDGLYKTIRPKHIGLSAFFTLAGIMVYSYLLIRSQGGTVLNWGRPDSLSELIHVVSRGQYSDLEKARSFEIVARQVARVARLILFEFSIAGFLLFLAGIKGLLDIRKKEKFMFFTVMMVTVVAALSLYFNLKIEMLWIMDVFLIPVYMGMAVFMAAGIRYLFTILDSRFSIGSKPVLYAFIILLAVFIVVKNYNKADQSRYFYGYDFGMNVLKSIDPPAIGLLEGDFFVMPQMYLKYVAKKTTYCPITTLFLYRPWGVMNLKEECPDVKFTAGENAPLGAKIHDVVVSNFREKNIFVSIFRKTLQEFYPSGDAALAPHGMTMKMTADKKETLKEGLVNLKKISYRGILENRLHMNSTTRLCLSNYSSAYMETGNALSAEGSQDAALKYLTRAVILATDKTKAQSLIHLAIQHTKMGMENSAVELYKKAIKANPYTVESYSNLAGIYNNRKQYDEAIKYAETAIKINPDFGEAYNNLAISYYHKGNKKKAIELMEKAVKASPGNEALKRNLMILRGEIK